MAAFNMLNTKYIIVPNQQTQAPEAQQNPGALGNACGRHVLGSLRRPSSGARNPSLRVSLCTPTKWSLRRFRSIKAQCEIGRAHV